MLVLTQKIGDVTHIGDDISVRVLSVEMSSNGTPTHVKLGFEAPKRVPIVRGKLDEKLREQGKVFTRESR